MDFRTILPPVSFDFDINYQNKILSIGSCFAENIAEILYDRKFNILQNPFGILYNPASIQNALQKLISPDAFLENDLFLHNGLWHNFDFHGSFSSVDKNEALRNMNGSLQKASEFVKTTDRLIITFGTANVFIHKKSGKIVANCHKVPAKEFERKRLNSDDIVKAFLKILSKLKKQNSNLKVIFSVSPVRHIRDGLIENQRSKATLFTVIDRLEKEFDFVAYFPSYELLIDDLRDYRFFKKDMVHPNEIAIDYIRHYFSDAFFDLKTSGLLKEIEKIIAAVKHRPFNPQSKEHKIFLEKQLEKIAKLEHQYSFLDFSREKRDLLSQK